MLHYNNPDRALERAEAQPLSIEENTKAVLFLNYLVIAAKIDPEANHSDLKLLQRFIDHKENLEALHDVTGRWDGLSKLQERSGDIYELYIKLKEIVDRLEKEEPQMLVQAVITAHKVTLDSLRQILIDTAYNANDDFDKNL